MPDAVDWSKIEQRPIKNSITPLANPKTLQDVIASCVPTLDPLGRTRKRVVRAAFERQSHTFYKGVALKLPPCIAATLKSKYDIINSILRDQIDRSEV